MARRSTPTTKCIPTHKILTITASLLAFVTVGKCGEVGNFLDKIFQQKTIYGLLNVTSEDLKISEEELSSYTKGLNSEDIDLNITQLIEKYGFSVEEYCIVSDKYVFKLFRIPGDGPLVFLMPGIASDADVFIAPGPGFGLGLLLAEQGYDVWLANPRGSKHVTKNPNLNTSEKDYWNFSWHEIGIYDLPVMIDYVLEKTNLTSLTYIGWSQGCTVFYVMCSLRPDYNNKIKLMIALSSVAFTSHSVAPFYPLLAAVNDELYPVLSALGIYSIFSRNSFSEYLQQSICKDVASAFIICENLVSIVGGFNTAQVNFPRLPVLYSHFPTGSSIKQFIHYVQLYKTGTFRQYDHGVDNLLKYGSLEPPSYPVEKVSAPVAIVFAQGDWLCVKEDVDILLSKLPNVRYFYTVPDQNFNHIDFVFAKDLKSLIFSQVVKLIKEYNNLNFLN